MSLWMRSCRHTYIETYIRTYICKHSVHYLHLHKHKHKHNIAASCMQQLRSQSPLCHIWICHTWIWLVTYLHSHLHYAPAVAALVARPLPSGWTARITTERDGRHQHVFHQLVPARVLSIPACRQSHEYPHGYGHQYIYVHHHRPIRTWLVHHLHLHHQAEDL